MRYLDWLLFYESSYLFYDKIGSIAISGVFLSLNLP